MPFKSEAQRRYLYETDPKMAKRWEKETPRNAKLPERATKKRRRRNSSIMAALEEGARRLGR
jgi:hypothetical protein